MFLFTSKICPLSYFAHTILKIFVRARELGSQNVQIYLQTMFLFTYLVCSLEKVSISFFMIYVEVLIAIHSLNIKLISLRV